MTDHTLADTKQRKGWLPLPAVISQQGPLSQFALRLENSAFVGTGGVSQNNRGSGFRPAYRNIRTGQTVISRFANGEPAPVHVLEGVPAEWVVARDERGCVCRVLATIISGFLRNGRFFTSEAAARVLNLEQSAQPR